MNDLNTLRQKIDSIDASLVNILNERARVSLEIGAAKKIALSKENGEDNEEDVHVYRPSREKVVYAQLAALNTGPLTDSSLCNIFREIMSASIALQKDVSISYLGPAGTFSHNAAHERFGSSLKYLPQQSITDVFAAVDRGQTTYGIVPFENSTFGSVIETLDNFMRTSVKVRAETYLPIHQYLLSNSELKDITKVYSHPQGLGQTQKWLSENLPNAVRIAFASTGEAAEKASLETGAAAVCSEICSKLHNLKIVEGNIEDSAENTTRFLVIGSASDAATSDDHTIVTITVDHRRPEQLCDALTVFKDGGINILRIDSRPSGQCRWHYVYFIECCGHFSSDELKKCIKDLESRCLNVVVLGSFPNQRP